MESDVSTVFSGTKPREVDLGAIAEEAVEQEKRLANFNPLNATFTEPPRTFPPHEPLEPLKVSATSKVYVVKTKTADGSEEIQGVFIPEDTLGYGKTGDLNKAHYTNSRVAVSDFCIKFKIKGCAKSQLAYHPTLGRGSYTEWIEGDDIEKIMKNPTNDPLLKEKKAALLNSPQYQKDRARQVVVGAMFGDYDVVPNRGGPAVDLEAFLNWRSAKNGRARFARGADGRLSYTGMTAYDPEYSNIYDVMDSQVVIARNARVLVDISGTTLTRKTTYLQIFARDPDNIPTIQAIAETPLEDFMGFWRQRGVRPEAETHLSDLHRFIVDHWNKIKKAKRL